jgi:cytochrome c556
MKRRAGISCAIAIYASLVVMPATAHDHATGVVKERMGMMEAMARSVKSIRERIRDKRDLPAIKADAKALLEHSRHLSHLFPAGSTQPPTDASAAIWKNWADFEARAKAMEAASANLANADVVDAAKLGVLVRAVSQSCSGCHELYRVKR